MMKRCLALMAALACGSCPSLVAQTVTLPRPSPNALVGQRIGLTDVTVAYCRPSVRDREIWGVLVPWGFADLGFGSAEESPWRAGANENTVFSTSTAIEVEGKTLPAGDYALFFAIEPSGDITAIFSRNHTSWGSYFYDPAEDALRVRIRWEDAAFTEMLAYAFTEVTEESATLALHWENKRIPLRLRVDTAAIVMDSLARELRGEKGFVHRSWVNAARYAVQNDLQLETALAWIDNALSGPFVGQETFEAYEIKAQILEHLGKPEEARGVMERAIQIGNVFDLHNYGRSLLAIGEPERALRVFQLNAERHPGAWPVHYGLARAYSALGDYPTALEWLQKATRDVPAGDTASAEAIAAGLEKLEQGKDIN